MALPIRISSCVEFNVRGNRVCVTSQNLIEMWAFCTRPIESNGLGLSPSHADLVLASVEHSVFRLSDSDEIYSEWRRLVVTHGVSGKKTHDARLVAAMLDVAPSDRHLLDRTGVACVGAFLQAASERQAARTESAFTLLV